MSTITAQPAAATLQAGVVEKLVNVTLEESDYQAIMNTKQEFGAVVQYLVGEFASGGVMIPADRVAYLSDMTNMSIHSSDDVTEIVENGIRRHSPNGMLRVTTDVDPAFAPGLEDLAYAQGRTVDEIVNEALNIIFTNSWIYSLAVDGGTIPLLANQRVILERLVGKSPLTSDSLVNWAQRTQNELDQALQPASEPRHEEQPIVQVQVPAAGKRMSKIKQAVADRMERATQ